MKYCTSCGFTAQPDSSVTNCPKCKSDLHLIKSPKLSTLLTELLATVDTLHSKEVKTAPSKIIELAKVMEKGNKRLIKEFTSRTLELAEISAELSVINKFAEQMGYTLNETTDAEPDPEAVEEHHEQTEHQHHEQEHQHHEHN